MIPLTIPHLMPSFLPSPLPSLCFFIKCYPLNDLSFPLHIQLHFFFNIPIIFSCLQSRTFYWTPNTYITTRLQYLDQPWRKQTQDRSCPKLGFLFPSLSLPLSPELLSSVFFIIITDNTSHQSPKPKWGQKLTSESFPYISQSPHPASFTYLTSLLLSFWFFCG